MAEFNVSSFLTTISKSQIFVFTDFSYEISAKIFFRSNPSMALSTITRRPVAGAYKLTESLLAKAHVDYDINYQGFLANHLPHGLYTLCALGGELNKKKTTFSIHI